MATPKQTKISSFFSSSPSSGLAAAEKKKRGSGKENIAIVAEEEEANPRKKLKVGEEEEMGAKALAIEKGEKLNDETVKPEHPREETPKKSGVPDEAQSEWKANSADFEAESPSPVVLSPEQKSKMAQNKMAAKLKLLTSKTNGLVTNFGSSWLAALEPEFSKDYFQKLSQFVNSERQSKTVYPPSSDVFAWTQSCQLDEIKVVILGQDPYHGPNQAHGLCFSVQKGIPPPPSLVNMYKELESDIEGFVRPKHGYLGGWAEQGVLLLNACLTVRKGEANSHKDKGWETFTDAVIKSLSKTRPPGLVFILWGSYAQKKGSIIDRKRPGHHVLSGPHPSPLSAHRGYFGCKHFSKTNELLRKEGVKPIDWTRLPLP